MEAELRHLLELVTVTRDERDGIWRERWATVAGMPVVATLSGIGMVAAAAATERLINSHHPRAILNFGCAGAHRRDILPGDVVIGERVVHHSAVHILTTGEEYYSGFGYEVGGEKVKASDLAADPALLAAARAALAGFVPEPWPRDLAWPTGVPYRPPVVHAGVVASADVWTQALARLDLLHSRHQSLCEDMEAAAIAQVCAIHGVPFLTIKDISNNEFHRASDVVSFDDFPVEEIGRRAAGLAVRVIERMGS
jgi:adenosylhomocysteine nucleosidase